MVCPQVSCSHPFLTQMPPRFGSKPSPGYGCTPLLQGASSSPSPYPSVSGFHGNCRRMATSGSKDQDAGEPEDGCNRSSGIGRLFPVPASTKGARISPRSCPLPSARFGAWESGGISASGQIFIFRLAAWPALGTAVSAASGGVGLSRGDGDLLQEVLNWDSHLQEGCKNRKKAVPLLEKYFGGRYWRFQRTYLEGENHCPSFESPHPCS